MIWAPQQERCQRARLSDLMEIQPSWDADEKAASQRRRAPPHPSGKPAAAINCMIRSVASI
jgi:hypothetical protein